MAAGWSPRGSKDETSLNFADMPTGSVNAERSRGQTISRIRGFYGLVDLPGAAAGGPGPGPGRVDDEPVRAVQIAELLVAGGAPIVQLRMKGASTKALIACGRVLRRFTRDKGVLFCINDRVDVALVVESDVVHLGQDDLPLAEARKLLVEAGAAEMAIGISTHSLAQAQSALAGGADYLGFGPVFATSTKENPDPVQGVAKLAEVCVAAGPVPVVALGGIDLHTVAAVAGAGAAAVAAVACIRNAPDPTAAAAELHRALLKAHHHRSLAK